MRCRHTRVSQILVFLLVVVGFITTSSDFLRFSNKRDVTTQPQHPTFAENMKDLERSGQDAVLVNLLAGFQMLVHPKSVDISVSNSIRRDRTYGEPTSKFLRESVKRMKKQIGKNVVMLDIGANLGYHSLQVAFEDPDTQVIAWEVMAKNVRLLRANIMLNAFSDRVRVIPAAASDEAGTAQLSISLVSPSVSTLGAQDEKFAKDIPWRLEPQTLEIRKTVGEQVLNDLQIRSAHVIKIDVEGHEYQALKGLGSLSKLGVRFVVAEFFPSLIRANGRQPADVLHLLSDQGFGVVASRFQGRSMVPVLPEEFDAFVKEISAENTHADIFCSRS